ncbi:branched-chain amino acid ABC transporter permease [Sneathiella chungangensis]|uniref:Branched-chain amino acid ABC transporter permease n=1 Tax=Sneathiella chungangensis TaxID=1418234 RepID=A0A845MFJ9_9PROT|nr:branched-chain amino acid ABC transporter permease [Sneathiella chungangensis]MZR22425.1 branched-chain amino acid ABC transporter permease [Sneathiella chungangensis]
MSELLPVFLDVTSYVLILVLVALGLMIVFGMMGVINMAHGELFMIGAFVMVAAQGAGLPFLAGLVLAPLVVGFLGLLIETALIRHIYHRPLDTILATWGLSIALKQLIVLSFGPESQSVTLPLDGTLTLGAFSYPLYRLVLMAVSAVLIGGTFWLFIRTDFGLMARAVIARPTTAATLGIDTRRMYRWSFVIGTALAGLAGALVAPIISVDPQMGLGYLVPGFLSILVGGAGALAGVLVGGAVVGGVGNLLAVWISPVAALITVYILAILIIRLKPEGILGGRRAK